MTSKKRSNKSRTNNSYKNKNVIATIGFILVILVVIGSIASAVNRNLPLIIITAVAVIIGVIFIAFAASD